MSTSKKTVLVTTDLSDESFRAFPAASELARAIDGRIVLLYVLPTIDHRPTGTPFVSPVPIPTDAELTARAKVDLESARSHFVDLDVDIQVRSSDDVDEQICDFAREQQVDYIVLATHGRSGLRRIVMGSVAESILRRATVPVLVVPLR